MERDRSSSGDLLRRAALEHYFGRPGQQAMQPSEQRIPVNVYETEDDVVVVAPMPGVEAENIDIHVQGRTLTLQASLRGEGQERRRYVVHEWTYGPYERTIELPVDVDASKANASHGNGVLALTLPKSDRSRTVRIPLRQTSSGTAEQEGHSGHHGADSGRS